VAITSGLHGVGEFIQAGVKAQNIFTNLNMAFSAKYLF